MDSEDVIELGSSDEESKPPPKKRKPIPNAMVHIPTNLPGITIKPTKPNKNLPSKGIIIKPGLKKPFKQNVTSKPNIILNPFVDKFKDNTFVRKTGNTVIFRKDIKPANCTTNYCTNPIQIKHSMIGQIAKVPKQIAIKKTIPNRPNTNNLRGPNVLNNLPSSITVKKSSIKSTKQIKPVNVAIVSGVMKNKTNLSNEKELLTVNLDDEDVNQPTASPQWYLRPEQEDNKHNLIEEIKENSEDNNLEEQNNKEPEIKKYVEITIEDSPIKPLLNNEVGRELPIVIEDSPCKIKDKVSNSETTEKAVPQSKKKLDYPNDEGNRQIVEIEIDPIETTLKEEKKRSANDMPAADEPETTKKIFTDEQAKGSTEIEFHPTYQAFIDTCFELENSDDMKKIVEKKIRTYYRQCPKEYVESEEFLDMVSSKIMSMKAGPEKMYLYIKDIVDELKLQKKMAKSYETIKESTSTVSEAICEVGSEEENEFDFKRSRQIKKLDKTIKKLHRAIQKLEEQEVDFDEEDDSVFLLTERYKERLVRVHAKYCQMTNTKMPSEPRIVIEARPGRPSGPAKNLEKFINKKVPIGTPLPFPDFHDVLRCVREANDEDQLGWNDMDIKEEARDLFARCGKKLQRRRQENEWRIAVSRIPMDMDPAEENESLKQKLNENKLIAAKREAELLNKYVDRQKELKLEAEEIGEKEAEESPVESDEEDMNEVNSSLQDKHKRKERLKRLIQEKTKKAIDNEIPITVNEKETHMNLEAEVKNSDDNDADKGLQESKTEGEIHKPPKDYITIEVEGDDLNNNDGQETVSSTNDVDSDIDELHLLQKLHSENEILSSSSETSDSDSPIAISDTLESDSDIENERKLCSDVISIENSSYSESEALAEVDNEKILVQANNESVEDALVTNNLELEFSTDANIGTAKISNEDSMENILLASSEEDLTSEKDEMVVDSETSVNLNDNSLSISETCVDFEGDWDKKNANRLDSVSSDICEVLDSNDVHEEVLNKNQSQSDMCVPKDGLSEPSFILNDDHNQIIECNNANSLNATSSDSTEVHTT